MLAINHSFSTSQPEKCYHIPYLLNPWDFLFYLSVIPIFLLAELPDLKMLEKQKIPCSYYKPATFVIKQTLILITVGILDNSHLLQKHLYI